MNRVKYIVAKWEIAYEEQYLHLSQGCQRLSAVDAASCVCKLEKVHNGFWHQIIFNALHLIEIWTVVGLEGLGLWFDQHSFGHRPDIYEHFTLIKKYFCMYFWKHIYCIYENIYTVFMKTYILYLWKHIYCIYENICTEF